VCPATRSPRSEPVTDLHLLLPRLPVSGSAVAAILASAFYSAHLNDVVGLGSILVAAVVVIVAGVFTLRNNLKSFWKTLAEERGEQVKVLEAELRTKAQELLDAQVHHTEQMAAFAEEQREVRHQLKTDLATLRGQLTVEQAKHDLSTVIGRLDSLDETLIGRERFGELVTAIDSQSGLLAEIRDALAARP
jgi:hypothetical protein